jgi:hypothetical protein
MAVIGVPSDKIHHSGDYFSPKKRSPRKGPSWTYRVICACDDPYFQSIHKVFYQNGKIFNMSYYPETALAHPYTNDPTFNLAAHMSRMLEALDCPVLNESKVVKEHRPDMIRCRACRHAIDPIDLPHH